METNVQQRLMSFILFMGISKSRFEQQCGLSNGYINSIKKGIGTEKLQNILRAFPQLNREWLLYGEGEMLKPQQPKGLIGAGVGVLGQNAALASPRTAGVAAGNIIAGAVSSGAYQQLNDYPKGCPVRPEVIECPQCSAEIEISACQDAIVPLAPSRIVYGPDISVSEWMRENSELCEFIDLAKIFKHATWLQQMESRAMEPRIMENTLLAMRPLDDWRSTPFDGGIYGVDIARPYMIVRRVFDEGERLRCEPFDPKHSAIYIDKAKVFDVCEIIAELKLNKRFRL